MLLRRMLLPGIALASVIAVLQTRAAESPTGSEPAELTISPGTTITATLRVQRNGFKDRVQFDVDNLPHGVIVDEVARWNDDCMVRLEGALTTAAFGGALIILKSVGAH